jgi:CYTH domain-containing protein
LGGGTSNIGGRAEIERVFLLRAMPSIPGSPEPLRIEQGYFPRRIMNPPEGMLLEGRLRRTIMPDGATVFHHTIKRGGGRVRHEIEREISREDFERDWPRTDPVRITKSRYCREEGGVVWEVDVFDRPAGLVMAEVELPRADAKIVIPEWINRVLAREVTDDPFHTNFAIALRLAGLSRSGW